MKYGYFIAIWYRPCYGICSFSLAEMSMADPYELKPATIARVARHAKPFVDSFDSVINRILDVYEQSTESEASTAAQNDIEIKNFDPGAPPHLTHTKVLSITFNGTKFPPELTTWNSLLLEAIRTARKRITSDQGLKEAIIVNFIIGKKIDDGYRYLDDVNLSVQGQDSNGAWKGAYHIARKLGIPLDVVFVWRDKDGVANAGAKGRFLLSRLHSIGP
jgi:hypothetical protein